MSANRHQGGEDRAGERDIESADMARMDLRLSDEEKAAAQREAERQGTNLSAVVRQAIAFYLGWLEGERARNDETPH